MIEVFGCAQGTPEWFQSRAGIPTASKFATVMAKGKGKDPSVTRRKYMLTLLGERLTGEQEESYSNAHMERGKAMESEARDLFQFHTDYELTQVGFILNRKLGAGCSPDALIGDKGMLEIKTRLPHLQLELLLDKHLPSENKAQVHGQLWIAEREWVEYVSHWTKLPQFRLKVERDTTYIDQIAAAVKEFNEELDFLENQFRNA